ncbi:hypothetical protein [Laspinema olomoucense]|uniref:Uncharacterized protein n=1 Tax=Laspinema olomoucense D3b TaxID=2953688 RepID=A0ABT2N539_9CYAN|nr:MULTISPECIES: hypothetical protein [unclassified Laspinema]MCT7977702.1 hypothetical protein [Laspinema sp. D3b]MCT7992548.1 hypothetical protein [Laspinema sp. D3c]
MDKVILLSELAESVKVIEGDLIEFFTILGFSLSKNKGKTTVTGSLQTEEGELDAVQTARQFVDLAGKLSQETNTLVSIIDLANQIKSNQEAQSTQSNSLPPANSEPLNNSDSEAMDDELGNSVENDDVDDKKEDVYNQLQSASKLSVKSSPSQALDTYGSLLEHLAQQNEAMAPIIALVAAQDLMQKTRKINPFTDPRTKQVFEELKKREAEDFMNALQANPDGQEVEVMELSAFMRGRLCQKSTNALPESSN